MKLLLLGLFLPLFSNALTNSTPALENDFTPVANIHSDQMHKGERFPGYCVGTIIHPRMMISAAHCWASTYQLRDDKLNFSLGKYLYKTMPDGTQKRIGYKEYVYGQGKVKFYFTRSLVGRLNQNRPTQINPNEDIAIAVFQEPIEKQAEYGVMPIASQTEMKGLLPVITKYWPTVVTTNHLASVTNTDTKRRGQLNNLQTSSQHLVSKSSSRVEEGDSGAPLLVRIGTTWKVAGVVKGRAETFFSNWDVFATADNKLCDIAGQIPDKDLQKVLCH